MESEDRRFQELLSSLSTRESSTLVIATVASSASFVLLGISPVSPHAFSGFLFPIAGLIGVTYDWTWSVSWLIGQCLSSMNLSVQRNRSSTFCRRIARAPSAGLFASTMASKLLNWVGVWDTMVSDDGLTLFHVRATGMDQVSRVNAVLEVPHVRRDRQRMVPICGYR